MSDALHIEINVPDATRRAIAACGDKPGLGKRLARAMDRENELSVNRIRQKLTGEVLNVQTGLLRKSIGRTQTLVLDDTMQSSIGSGAQFGKASVKYAAFWEYGFQGTETVGQHLSHRSSRRSFSFGGKTVSKKLHGADFTVKAHTRKVNQAPRSFVGSTIADRAPQYAASLTDAAEKFLGGDV